MHIIFLKITQVEHCKCKSSCSVKRKTNGTRGCPCKGKNMYCSVACQCGTRDKPCKNKVWLKSIGHFLFNNFFGFIQNCCINMYVHFV